MVYLPLITQTHMGRLIQLNSRELGTGAMLVPFFVREHGNYTYIFNRLSLLGRSDCHNNSDCLPLFCALHSRLRHKDSNEFAVIR